MIFGSLCIFLVILIFSSFGSKSERDCVSTWLRVTFVIWNAWILILHTPIVSGSNGIIPSSKSTNLGATLVLDCAVPIDTTNNDNQLILWKKQGLEPEVLSKYAKYPIHEHDHFKGRIRLVKGISLEISHIKADDEGWYECSYEIVAGNSTGKKGNGTWIYLDVKTPPKITNSSPGTVRHQQGDTVTLFCEPDGDPTPTVTWSQNGVPIYTSPRISISPKGTHLTIRNLQRSDGGTYSCTCTNPIGTISQRIDIIVEGAAYILTAPVNTTAIDGQRVEFQCDADAYPNNITYQWLFRGQNIQLLPGYGNRINIRSTGELIIYPVTKDDMGWYVCRPTNGVGRDPEAQAYLNVTYKPRILAMPSQVTWALGLQAQLDCPVDANPPVNEIIWLKNGYDIDFQSEKITQLANGSLLIYQVDMSDKGDYRCTAISSVGKGEPSPIVQVNVRDPPQFTRRPLPRYFMTLGDRVVLPCAATGEPEPSIHWRKVSGDLVQSSRVQILNGNLTIGSVIKEDHGNYECEAENDVARMVVTTELIIQKTTPHAPYNVTVSTTWFEATLKWIPAYDGGSQQTYVIWYRSTDGGSAQWTTMRVEPPNSTSFTLYNLTPDITYEFKVSARNRHGIGSDSEIVRAKTLGNTTTTTSHGNDGPLPTSLPTNPSGQTYRPTISESIGPKPSSPRNVTAVYENGAIRISWRKPPFTNVKMFYYVLEYRTNNNNNWMSIGGGIDLPLTSYVYRDIKPSTTYQFRMITYSVVSYSYPSAIVTVTTPPADTSGLFLSPPEIGGIVGGLLFLLVSILLVVIAVLCSKRKARHRGDKYGNVKYIGPADEMDSHMPIHRTQNTSEWYSWDSFGGTGSLSSIDAGNGVFVVPYSNVTYREDTLPRNSYFQESRVFDPEKCLYRQPDKSKKRNAKKRKQQIKHLNESENGFEERDFSQSLRSHQRFPPENSVVNLDQSSRLRNTYVQGRFDTREPIRNDNSFHRSDMQRTPSFQNKSFPVLQTSQEFSKNETDEEDNDSYDDENGFCPKVPPLPKGYRFPYKPEIYMGPYHQRGFGDPYSYPGDTDDVFIPPRGRVSDGSKASFPRHSSMKPSYQTYLTGDPVNDSFGQTFGIDDLSSVHPSFIDRPYDYSPDGSHDILPRMFPSSSKHRVCSDPDATLMPGDDDFPDWTFHDDTLRRSDTRTPSRVHFENSVSNGTVIERSGEENMLGRRRVARVSPNRKSDSEQTSGYTREQLQGAVDRVRRSLRARKSRLNRSSGSETDRSFDTSNAQVESRGRHMPYLSDNELPSRGPSHRPRSYNDSDVAQIRSRLSHSDSESPSRVDHDRHGSDRAYRYEYDIEPYKTKRALGSNRNSISSSGRGSSAGRTRYLSEPRYHHEQVTPDSLSSGIGSKNTSHGTGSSSMHSRVPRTTSASVSSLVTPQDHDTSQDSSPFDGLARERRDTSADENYEFDAVNALDSDLMNTLHKYSTLHDVDDDVLAALESGLSTSDFYNDLYPKPSRRSRYNNSEERFEKLRQEFHQYQRSLKEGMYYGPYVPAMDSEML